MALISAMTPSEKGVIHRFFALIESFLASQPEVSITPAVVVLALALFACGCHSRKAGVLTGDMARHRLAPERRALLSTLESRSTRPVKIAVDSKTGTLLSLALEYPLNMPPGTPLKDKAMTFLQAYQALLDPKINPHQYTVLDPGSSPGCSEDVVTLNRFVDGLPVLGSNITFSLSRTGTLVNVVNGVASVGGRVFPQVTRNKNQSQLAQMLPKGAADSQLQHISVIVPEFSGSKGHLRKATLLVWGTVGPGNSPGYSALLSGLANSTLSLQVINHAGEETRPDALGVPRYHLDPRTAMPDSISYHGIGGVELEHLPGDINPTELVYRFLSEHPSLFHTGLPRCQFSGAGIAESPMLPGVQFVRMQQRYLGLPVFGAQLVFEVHDHVKVMSVAGHTLPAINVDPEPKITSASAAATAKQVLITALIETGLGAQEPLLASIKATNPTTELVVFPGELVPGRQLPTRLAYMVRLDQFVYFVDAQNREILYSFATRHPEGIIVNDGRATGVIGRLSYVTVASGTATTGVTSTGALPLNADAAVIGATISTTALFYDSLGWVGIDGRRGTYTANTNVAIETGCPNAFFDIFLTREAYFCIGVGSQPDVVAHEFTHGVIENSSALVYEDESGALNESYADLFGNLVFPDAIAPGAPSGWQIGESPTIGVPLPATTRVFRDMANPGSAGITLGGAFIPDPGNMAGYIPRNIPSSGCNVLPFSCDFGFVHENSGIVNLAHVMLDGQPGGSTPSPPFPGIGRPKLTLLAFLTMTTRFTPWALLSDAALQERNMADTLAMRGATALDGSVFTQADADQVPLAYGMVGLAPGLSSGWSEPVAGFIGTDTFDGAGETTSNGCPVTNITASMRTISGTFQADLSPTTATGPSVNFAGISGIAFSPLPAPGTTPPPLGTTTMRHSVSWFNIFGNKPTYTTQVIAPAPAGSSDCIAPPGTFQVERVSAITAHTGFPFLGFGTDTAGNAASTMNPACTITGTQVELVDSGGNTISGPANGVSQTTAVCFLFCANFTARATITGPTPTAPPNLSTTVSWSRDLGTDVRYRLRFFISQPATGGISCNP